MNSTDYLIVTGIGAVAFTALWGVSNKQNQIIKQNQQIMGAIENLEAKVEELQTVVDAEQAQIKTLIEEKEVLIASQAGTITSLEEINADLQRQLANGENTVRIEALSNKIQFILDDVKSTVADGEDQGGEGQGDESEEPTPDPIPEESNEEIPPVTTEGEQGTPQGE